MFEQALRLEAWGQISQRGLSPLVGSNQAGISIFVL